MPTPISVEHHVARHCRNRHIIRVDGRPVGVFGDAFSLRANETYLSAGWVEFFGGERLSNLANLRNVIAKAREIKPHDGLAVMRVNCIIEAGQSKSIRLRVLHEPTKENPAYAAIRGVPRDNLDLLEALAIDAVVDLVISADLPKQS